MSRVNRRAVLAFGAAAVAADATGQLEGQTEERQQVHAYDIPQELDLLGVLGKPVCSLVEFSGVWVIAYDRYVKDSVPSLRITQVDGVDVEAQSVLFPVRLVHTCYQTSGLETAEAIAGVQEGDSWDGLAYEFIELNWVPLETYQLPGVVPWNDGRLARAVSSFVCVRFSHRLRRKSSD